LQMIQTQQQPAATQYHDNVSGLPHIPPTEAGV
jgi:hypothetical protein